jgi:acyl carrier protein
MYELVEPQLRPVVAEHLGVDIEELIGDVSLRDDLAADSLDLAELAQGVEGEFAIVMPERILAEVRTYGELVHAIAGVIQARHEAEARGAEPPQRIWTRIVPPAGESRSILERTGWLTPYTAETIAEDVERAEEGARIELTIAAATAESFVRARRRFAGLGKPGVQVTVRRADGFTALPVHSAAGFVIER